MAQHFHEDEYEIKQPNIINTVQKQQLIKTVKDGVDNLPEHYITKYKNQTNLDRIEVARRISKETGISPTALGLVHLFKSKDIDAIPIVGSVNREFLDDSLASIRTPEK